MEPHKWIITLTLCFWWNQLQGQTVDDINSRTGIYFDEVGTLLFYPMRWKVVTYINLEPTHELWRQTKIHRRQITDFCQKVKNRTWYHYTDCDAFGRYMRSKTKYIDNLKDLVAEYWAGDNQEDTNEVS
jgi:hypothetical protein